MVDGKNNVLIAFDPTTLPFGEISTVGLLVTLKM